MRARLGRVGLAWAVIASLCVAITAAPAHADIEVASTAPAGDDTMTPQQLQNSSDLQDFKS